MKNIERISSIEKYIEKSKLDSKKDKKEVMSKYKELYQLYCVNDDLESVKRSLFLQWFSISEPQELTWIPDFDQSMQYANIKRIQEIIRNHEYDDELIMMLKHYYAISAWYFSDLGAVLNELDEVHTVKKSPNKYKDRGIMGVYWESVTN